jgi:hypothetical protein
MDEFLREHNQQRLECLLALERRNRTIPQNKILHALADKIAEQIAGESGHSKLEIKRFATLEALGVEEGLIVFEWQGQRLTDVKKTSDMSVEQCSRLVDVLKRQAEGLRLVPRNAEHVEVI